MTDDDYDMYYEIWQQFDPNGTQYIKYGQLSDFLDVLESPLQIHKPNKYKIISMDIPICKVKFNRYLRVHRSDICLSAGRPLLLCGRAGRTHQGLLRPEGEPSGGDGGAGGGDGAGAGLCCAAVLPVLDTLGVPGGQAGLRPDLEHAVAAAGGVLRQDDSDSLAQELQGQLVSWSARPPGDGQLPGTAH